MYPFGYLLMGCNKKWNIEHKRMATVFEIQADNILSMLADSV